MILRTELVAIVGLTLAEPSFAQSACDSPAGSADYQACYSELDHQFEQNAMATALANLEFQLFDDPENDEARRQCYLECRETFKSTLIGCAEVFGQWDSNEKFVKTHNVCRSSAREKLSACLKPFAVCG